MHPGLQGQGQSAQFAVAGQPVDILLEESDPDIGANSRHRGDLFAHGPSLADGPGEAY